jgi:hypothetical protein
VYGQKKENEKGRLYVRRNCRYDGCTIKNKGTLNNSKKRVVITGLGIVAQMV